MRTKFGKYLRKIAIDCNETIKTATSFLAKNLANLSD